jgi:hypothetical protein
LGIKHGVIVLPSVYNHENTVLLDAIRYFNGTYRGVCVLDLDSKIENSTLDEYHAVGVGGIRLNYGNEGSDEEISATATKAAMIALPRDTWGGTRAICRWHSHFVRILLIVNLFMVCISTLRDSLVSYSPHGEFCGVRRLLSLKP